MPLDSHEIRVCNSCGLRYPVREGDQIGIRCPACSGATRQARRANPAPAAEPMQDLDLSRVPANQGPEETWAVLLDNIRSAWNVGSILRTAEGFGFAHAYLCGITPTPDNEGVQKTSLGAEETVRWSYHKNAVELATDLKSEFAMIFALEEDKRAVLLNTGRVVSRPDIAHCPQILTVGNEVTGVDPDLLDLADGIFYIPMQGKKKSFNVATAFGIAAYALR